MADVKSEVKGEQEAVMSGGILSLNALSYRLKPDLSVAIARNNQSQFFNTAGASAGQNVVMTLNSGSAFIDWRRSFFVFTVKFTSVSSAAAHTQSWFGPNGSVLNLINSFTLYSRGNAQIERVQNCHQLASSRLYMEHGRDWTGSPPTVSATGANVTNTFGPAHVYGAAGSILATGVDEKWETNHIVRFCVPCGELSPAFRNSESLWPASLCSGMRMELQLESAQKSIMCTTNTDVPGYEIQEIRLETECYQLSDLVLRTLNDMAVNGLEVVTTTAFQFPGSRPGTSASINLDIGKSVSRALGFVWRERPAQPESADATFDYFATTSETITEYVTSWQARIGNLYFPNSIIKNVGGASGWRTASNELYTVTLQGLSALGLGNKAPSTNDVQFRAGRTNIYQTLERQGGGAIDLAGIPLSNARSLSIQMIKNTTPTTSTLIDVFLFHVILIRVFLSGCNVEI